jgi:hypothetical protein
MKCSNKKCENKIKNYYTCTNAEKLCKNSFMTEHMIENHNNSQLVKQRRFSGIKSPFMKAGLFLKEKKRG